MKKLLTIVCALSLVMAFTLPASATEPIVDDTQLGLLQNDTAQANDNSTSTTDNDVLSDNFSNNSDDDNVSLLSGNSDDDNVNLLSGNTDASDDDFMSDNDNSVNDSFKVDTEIKTEIDDIASNNDNREDYKDGQRFKFICRVVESFKRMDFDCQRGRTAQFSRATGNSPRVRFDCQKHN